MKHFICAWRSHNLSMHITHSSFCLNIANDLWWIIFFPQNSGMCKSNLNQEILRNSSSLDKALEKKAFYCFIKVTDNHRVFKNSSTESQQLFIKALKQPY